MKRTLIASAAFASLLVATSASAADLPVYTKAPAVAAVYDWTGFYIGTNLGYSFGRGTTNGNVTGTSTTAGVVTTLPTLPLSGRADVNGFIGGGQLGYNWQQGAWVFGLEGDIQFSNERGSGDVCTGACPAGFVFTRDYKLDWFGTGRGRVGFLPAERILLYATGGLAYGSFTGSSSTLPLDIGTWSHVNAGWTVGAGVESALGSNWSVKFEYLYMDLGSVGGSSATNTTTVVRTTTALAYSFNTKFTDNIVRVGLNYKFGGPGAVVARY
uniref:outer membrane beta-barrel protein n=1 Tax=Bradyrhizobium sp. TaxID=376 RepID=UPI0025BC6AD0